MFGLAVEAFADARPIDRFTAFLADTQSRTRTPDLLEVSVGRRDRPTAAYRPRGIAVLYVPPGHPGSIAAVATPERGA